MTSSLSYTRSQYLDANTLRIWFKDVGGMILHYQRGVSLMFPEVMGSYFARSVSFKTSTNNTPRIINWHIPFRR